MCTESCNARDINRGSFSLVNIRSLHHLATAVIETGGESPGFLDQVYLQAGRRPQGHAADRGAGSLGTEDGGVEDVLQLTEGPRVY